MGLRRKSREIALQFLFAHDFQKNPGSRDAVAAELEKFRACFDAGKKALPYARTLIFGICDHLEDIDDLLSSHSHNWRLERMSLVDRNILRIAVYEICHLDDVPGQVAINEALEIARRFSISDSVSFVNGILDAVQTVRAR